MRDAPLPQPPDERTDDELMGLAAAGDGAAYEALVRRHQARLRAYCARWCGSAVVGDDLAQECFVEIWGWILHPVHRNADRARAAALSR